MEVRDIMGKSVHDIWMLWAENLMKEEKLSEERVKRWESYMIKYEDLDEENKEKDRVLADKIVNDINLAMGDQK